MVQHAITFGLVYGAMGFGFALLCGMAALIGKLNVEPGDLDGDGRQL